MWNRNDLTKVVMDNVTFEGIKKTVYKSGYNKGFWTGTVLTGMGALYLAAKAKIKRDEEEAEKNKDREDEVKKEEEES